MLTAYWLDLDGCLEASPPKGHGFVSSTGMLLKFVLGQYIWGKEFKS